MGSWSDLYIAGHSIVSMKSLVDPAVMTMFGRNDRKVYVRKRSEAESSAWSEFDGDEEETAYEYRSTAGEVAERLDVMGFTLREVEEQFTVEAENVAAAEEHWDKYLAKQRAETEMGVPERSLRSVRYVEFLRGLEFAAWINAVREAMRRRRSDAQGRHERPGETTDLVLAYVLGEYGPGGEGDLFGFPNAEEVDLRIMVRALLAVVDPQVEIVLDYTDLVGGGWYSEEDDLRELALQNLREEYVISERLIVLTEGSTDAEVLRRTLEVRYPHLKDYVSFPDFHGSNAEGGTGALVNLVKGFAGSGVPSRIVALFDNDAAGEDAKRKLKGTALPDNIKVLSLPVLEYAKSYPTVGPQGTARINVNGCACSLELYFGRDVLEDDDGELALIEWSGRVRVLDRYQGAVVGKAALRNKYFSVLSRVAESSEAWEQHDWEPMERVFAAIFGALEH